jgi:hypothetical protein
MATPELTPWLRTVADPIDQRLLDEVFGYESGIDGEFACCHTSEEIERGECPDSPDRLSAVRWIGARYADLPGYRDDWKPTP